MTNTELAVVVGVVAVGGYLVYQHHKTTSAASLVRGAQPTSPSGGSTVGNAIAGFGGSAVSQLGKEAGTWAAGEISSLFG